MRIGNHIKSLHITNFRGIKNLEIEDLAKINLIVGLNNSCKTTVLEALFLNLGMSNPQLFFSIHSFRDLIINEENDLSFIFHKFDYKNSPIITAKYNKNSFRELKISPHKKKAPTSGTMKLNGVDGKQEITFDTSFEDTYINELDFNFINKEYQKPAKPFTSKLHLEQDKMEVTKPNAYNEKHRGVYVTPKISLSLNLEKKLEDILIKKEQEDLIEILKLVDNNISDIIFGINRMIYFDIGLERLMPINLAGDGIRRLLAVILAVYDAKDGVVLIDEIDNGLHFSALKKLWISIFSLAQKLNVQVFVTSHNIEVLKYLKDAVEDFQIADFRNEVRSYTLRKMKDYSIKSYTYDFEQFSHSIKQGVEIR